MFSVTWKSRKCEPEGPEKFETLDETMSFVINKIMSYGFNHSTELLDWIKIDDKLYRE